MTLDEKIQFIENKYKENFTYHEIGKLLNISRQRVHQIYKGYKSPDSLKYSGGRDKIREKIRTRDNHTCQICKKLWINGKRRFDIHHLDEAIMGKINTRNKGFTKYDRENSNKLVTLCHSCHLKLHWGKITT